MAKKKDNSQLDVPGVRTEPPEDITASLHPALRRHLLRSQPWLRALPEDGEDSALFNPVLRHLLRINHPKQFREFVLERAKHGDWDLLGAYIAIGGVIAREERKFLTAVLHGKKKRSANRAGLMRTQVLKSARVAMAELKKTEEKTQGEADAEAARVTGVGARTIQRDREDFYQTRNEAGPGEMYVAPVPDEAVEMVDLRDRILRFPEEIAAQRYAISLTALSPHFMSR